MGIKWGLLPATKMEASSLIQFFMRKKEEKLRMTNGSSWFGDNGFVGKSIPLQQPKYTGCLDEARKSALSGWTDGQGTCPHALLIASSRWQLQWREGMSPAGKASQGRSLLIERAEGL